MSKSWQLHRRTFLRGLGTALALPMLDVMAPGLKALAAESGAAAAAPNRMAFIYIPNGVNVSTWFPEQTGTDYKLSTALEPLTSHQQDITVFSGLNHQKAFGNGDGGGDHARATATYLTGCQARKTAGADIKIGVSVDQVAANQVGNATRFSSLELSCDRGQEAGACDSGYSCAYQFNISWRSASQPMNPEIEPKAAFNRLFGNGAPGETEQARQRRERYDQSVLDFVRDDAQGLNRKLGANDRRKLEEYFTAIRDVEKRISTNGRAPVHIPEDAVGDFNAEYTFERHIRLMLDIMTLAFQTDSTRIATFMIAHDGSNRPYPQAGVNNGHHHVSHHRNQEKSLSQLTLIDKWHVQQLAYFLDKLKAVKEGEGNLLDNSMVLFGAGISDPNSHSHANLPTVLAGRGAGSLTPGRHLKVDNVPMSNLYLSMLKRMNVTSEAFGDSTGLLEAIG